MALPTWSVLPSSGEKVCRTAPAETAGGLWLLLLQAASSSANVLATCFIQCMDGLLFRATS